MKWSWTSRNGAKSGFVFLVGSDRLEMAVVRLIQFTAPAENRAIEVALDFRITRVRP
jgi:hypothetical protein